MLHFKICKKYNLILTSKAFLKLSIGLNTSMQSFLPPIPPVFEKTTHTLQKPPCLISEYANHLYNCNQRC